MERRVNPEDRRACLVQLSAAGKGLEKELTRASLRVRERFTADLTPREYDRLCELLKKLRSF